MSRTLILLHCLGLLALAGACTRAGEENRSPLNGADPIEQTAIAAQAPVYLQSEAIAGQNLPFSQAVRVGHILYLSGQIGTSPEAGGLVVGGILSETRQTMENIKAVLEQNGSSLDQVIKCTCMLADIAEWEAMNSVYVTYFPTHKPARSAFAGTGLALGARVEIECMAYVE